MEAAVGGFCDVHALVLVFAVTRVILIPQGEFVALAALTVSALENGSLPGTVWLLITLGVLAVRAASAGRSDYPLFRYDRKARQDSQRTSGSGSRRHLLALEACPADQAVSR